MAVIWRFNQNNWAGELSLSVDMAWLLWASVNSVSLPFILGRYMFCRQNMSVWFRRSPSVGQKNSCLKPINTCFLTARLWRSMHWLCTELPTTTGLASSPQGFTMSFQTATFSPPWSVLTLNGRPYCRTASWYRDIEWYRVRLQSCYFLNSGKKQWGDWRHWQHDGEPFAT